jgi:hypothetical protein
MTKTVPLTRTELYDRVWETPIHRLAKEFGVSDVGLAKICRRHDIPVPPRGHWAKKAHGKRVTTISLPANEASMSVAITIARSEVAATVVPVVESTPPELASAREYEARRENEIRVPETLQRRHSLI